MTTEAASIMLVDDHPLLRKGLKQLIAMEDDMTVVAEASNGPDALLLAAEHDPDLIVLDLNMQGMDGIETLKRLRDSGVTSRIIMLTVSDADDDVVAAITNGADGYLLKDMEPELLLEQIHRAVTGKMVLSEAITEILATALRQPTQSTTSQLSNLTNREHEILSLIAKGMSNKVIARELDISDGTVKVHVKHLLKKLGLRSRVEAAVWMVNLQGNKATQ
ncbi:two-component system response regulator NarL [Idiomarina sp.]|uniref:two-component system response regulator NarL n=1 Tax=Idiomarina sp. TaxID=1874361 RepID=UPI003A93AA7E